MYQLKTCRPRVQTMAEANSSPRSFMEYLPELLALVEKENDLLSKALHHKRMKDVCYQIKAHYLWVSFEQFFPASDSQHCSMCGGPVSPEFSMSRHLGLCYRNACLPDESFDGPFAHEWQPIVGLGIELCQQVLPFLFMLPH